MQIDLEVSRNKAAEKQQAKDVLRRRLEGVLSLNQDLTVQIQEMTATVGYRLITIDQSWLYSPTCKLP